MNVMREGPVTAEDAGPGELFPWNPEWDMGILSIDLAHREMLAQMEGLVAALAEGREAEAIEASLAQLEDYIGRHFQEEELLMDRLAYPRRGEHKATHERFRKELGRVDVRNRQDARGLPTDVVNLYYDWFRNHLQNEDCQLAQYVRAVGAFPDQDSIPWSKSC
jgi:hemerythrin-like metal-binding protein